jgi:hypothetical protein
MIIVNAASGAIATNQCRKFKEVPRGTTATSQNHTRRKKKRILGIRIDPEIGRKLKRAMKPERRTLG